MHEKGLGCSLSVYEREEKQIKLETRLRDVKRMNDDSTSADECIHVCSEHWIMPAEANRNG